MTISAAMLKPAAMPHRNAPRRALLALLVCLSIALAGCSHPGPRIQPATLEPLQLADKQVTLAQLGDLENSPDLLAIDDEMRDFVARYVDGSPRERQRLLNLHGAVRGPATLGIDYDPAAEGTAQEVFYRGSANCLSYATLFIALAREAGLNAQYQWLKVRPKWSLQGERVMLSLHVNVLVSVGRQDRFMVDIDPLPSREITGTQVLRDEDALALYHANIAMYALSDGRTEEAWLHSARALEYSPQMAQLWVNIGVVYRAAGQHGLAERYYLHALDLDPGNDSAMNNLVVLYSLQGRDADQAYWEARVTSYRDANPYYHAWLGDRAADEDDWGQAADYYARALALQPEDSRLLYAMGLAQAELEDTERALAYLQQAIEHATLRSDIEVYELQLRTLAEGPAADG